MLLAERAKDSFSANVSIISTSCLSSFSSNFSPFLFAFALLTKDITPANCLGPITAIFADGHVNKNLLLNALPDIAYVPAPYEAPIMKLI